MSISRPPVPCCRGGGNRQKRTRELLDGNVWRESTNGMLKRHLRNDTHAALRHREGEPEIKITKSGKRATPAQLF